MLNKQCSHRALGAMKIHLHFIIEYCPQGPVGILKIDY